MTKLMTGMEMITHNMPPISAAKYPRQGELEALLSEMQMHGQSVLLNWGEDTNAWECSYVAGDGRRYVGFGKEALASAKAAMKKRMEAAGK